MNETIARVQQMLSLEQFPRSSAYDIEWVSENEMGPNAMWLAEFLSEKMQFSKGMKVLDLGCGKGLSSVFLAKEFGVNVYATDLWIHTTDNFLRIKEMEVEDLVTPIHADAMKLPFARGFFDAIVSLDAYHYFGTNEMYLEEILSYLKPNGQIGIVVPSVLKEFHDEIPESIKPYWEPYLYTHHTPEWWRKLWEHSDQLKVEVADTMPNGYENWLLWDKTLKDAGMLRRSGDVEMLLADDGIFSFCRVVGTKF
ncbi:SAM-dependent methyltransferase [Lachnoclostridium phytofermentans]|uniref:Methyltransferase type 11 n=1 Tax=Lachnoclostridium phytofermentans (strain ATCC 700394 / DSM 18823 / ISDg) TaxID=357809 RepID=A9KR28_LACP7|nr:methyltransferase domain-containing protein [Lachnoclostridium phytofermentans]ABX43507.1 Methyltransferase type 11 [Lachnoclostridium phytofermentans ISDg]